MPEPDGPDEEDELALLDVDRGVAQGDDVALVDLGDVLELDHVAITVSGREAVGYRPMPRHGTVSGA